MTPVLIKADGTTEEIQPSNGTDFTFAELYPVLATDMIEIISLYDGTIMLMDEEGSFKDQPKINEKATDVAETALNKVGRVLCVPLAGDVVHCDSEYIK